jgi:hypothetical protein
MENYPDELIESEDGFSKQLCAGHLVQHSIAANSSLLAASPYTGLLLVGASAAETNAVLLFVASDLINALKETSDDEAGRDLRSVPHLAIALPAPCLSVHWSPDGTLAAAVCTNGNIVFYATRALTAGSADPLCSALCPLIRQCAWSAQTNGMYVLCKDLTLHHLAISSTTPILTPLRSNVTSVTTSLSLVAFSTTSGATPSITLATAPLTSATLTDRITYPLDYATEDSPPFIDAIAFISPDTLAIHILTAGSDEDEHLLLELDSPDAPEGVKRAVACAVRYNALNEPVRKPATPAAFCMERSTTSGPCMLTATFPPPFTTTLLADSIRNEDHIIHLFQGPDISDDASGTHWQEIVNQIEGLKLNLPNTPPNAADPDELFVPNYVVGATAVVTHSGESVRDPSNESGEPAEVQPSVGCDSCQFL